MLLTQSTHIIDNGNMNLQEQLNRIQEMMGINESITPKDKMINLIQKRGLFETIKLIGIDNVTKALDTTPIDLARDYFVDKKYSIKDFDIKSGGYDFNFMITDIDENDDIWNVYVKILDGQVTLILHDNETYDLWDSDLWQQDFWWEIQSEISDVIYDIVAPFTPIQIDIDINHNLE